jgi:PAS domain S-box-containing protein
MNDDAFHRLARMAVRATGADGAAVWVLEEEGARRAGHSGAPPPDALCAAVLRAGTGQAGPGGVGVPVMEDGRVCGVVAVAGAGPWNEDAVHDVAACALTELRLRRETVEVRRREEFFRALVENAGDVANVIGPDGVVRYVTPAVERLLGYAPEELVGRGSLELVHPAQRGEIAARLGRLPPGERGPVVELRMLHRDGSVRLFDAQPTNLQHHPAVRGIVVNARDVTEREQHAAELRESERRAQHTARRMRAVADSATAVLGARTQDELQALLAEACAGVLEFDDFALSLYRPEEDALHFLAGTDQGLPVPAMTVPVPGTPSERVVRERRSLVTLHSGDPAAQGARRVGTMRRSESVIRAPMLAGDRVLGLATLHSYTPGLYTPDDVEVVETLAAVAAATLLNVEFLAERDAAVAATRESETRFRLATLATNDAIWDWNLASRRLHWSDALHTTFGHAVDEASARIEFWEENLHPGDRDRVTRGIYAAIEEGREAWSDEYRFRRADGSYADVLDRGLLSRDATGRAVRMIGSVQDISARKAAESALRESGRWVRALFEGASEGIVVHDMEGRILDVNRRFCTLLGYTRRQMLRMRVADIDASHPAAGAEAMWARMKPGAARQLSGLVRRRDGATLPMEVGLTRVERDEGPVMLALLRDVSERVRMEEQLRQASRMEAVGRLAGGVAHDFNNLLMVIIGFAAMLDPEVPEGGQGAFFLREIRKAADRAADLTRQLLAFGRRQVLKTERLELNEAVRDAGRMLRRLIPENIEMALELGEGAGRVEADPTQLHQVIVNLAVNARDAMPGGGRVTIRTAPVRVGEAERRARPEVEEGWYASLSVADTGPGIAAEDLPRIFEPFFTTKPVGEGTGLGLATVYGIVKQSGGHVWAETVRGEGSTFVVLLPRHERAAAPPPPAPVPAAHGGGGRILLVEDDDAVRLLARVVLADAGYEVVQARDGEEALRRHAAAPADLLLTDVLMPRMSGPELAARIRDAHPGMPVVLMSGYAADAVEDGALLPPRTLFLQKPFDPDTLRAAVSEALRSRL